MSAVLEVRGLRKSFDDFTAVAGIDLALPEGGITAVIGPNGAGKTTFINLLSGKLVPNGGRIVFAGADVTRLPPSARVRAGSSSITCLIARSGMKRSSWSCLMRRMRSTNSGG